MLQLLPGKVITQPLAPVALSVIMPVGVPAPGAVGTGALTCTVTAPGDEGSAAKKGTGNVVSALLTG
jgi:hypothetical protein